MGRGGEEHDAADASVAAHIGHRFAGTVNAVAPVPTKGEMAASIAFLASDESPFTTGAVLPVDGGLSV